MNLCKIKNDLVEQASESLFTRILSLFFLLFLGSLWSSGGLGGGDRSSGCVSVRVGDTVLQLLYLGPAVLGGNGNRQDLLVAVDDGVHDGWEGGEVDGQRDACNGGDSAGERLEKLLLANVENTGWEGVALVVDLGDTHTVCERRDVQHVEQGSLGSSDLGTGLDELQVVGNFNGTTGNFGWDTESLEERGLSGFHTSVTGWDEDIVGSDGTSSGWSGNLVGENLVTDGLEVAVGEDESDVAPDEWKETLVLGGVGDEALDGTSNL
jgi:hypothetical protein